MSNKTRTLLKLISIIIVAFMVLMALNVVIIPALAGYKFWLTVIAFCLLLLSSK
jgi:hypothetical protein